MLAELVYADHIALTENTIKEAEDLLNSVDSAAQSIGDFLNAAEPKITLFNATSESSVHALGSSEVEKVEDSLYLGGYINGSHDMDTRIRKAWGALNTLSTVWFFPIKKETKTRLFEALTESILLYGCDSWTLRKSLTKNINGTNTQMLRKVQNISWKAYVTSKDLYSPLPCPSEIIKRRRLALIGREFRHNEPAGKVLFWTPEEPRQVGRPNTTLKDGG